MGKELKATHDGVLDIDGVGAECAVLSNETRVLTLESLFTVLGRTGKPQKQSSSELAHIVGAKNLKPFVDAHLKAPPKVFRFRMRSGQRAWGVDALALPRLCRIYSDALCAGVLRYNQIPIAHRCVRLLGGFSNTGVIALVDEATGYQEIRSKDALQRYLRMECGPYEPMFPEALFKVIYRFHNWEWKGDNKHPQCLGSIFNWLLYDRMAPGVRTELCARNPIDDRGNRPNKHHQYLSDDIGRPILQRMIMTALMVAKISRTWESFKRNIDIAMPPLGKQPPAVQAVIAEQLYLAGFEPTNG